ncbi:RidA family protein [Nocardioides carbamazepini]|jgi:2-iminobutanoate/2-iminopropanoate deaminase|uniref:RidA family protein n=1 Tax=Nocardioides carbamazepini TaxID=2854259 RepID=UPI00214A8173|nr:Rid family hydrolase [Nocardioides carbamazepini]MCR1781877.1 RidA family protein [Nocardioides carbamazepini]
MTRTPITTSDAPRPAGGYSQGIVANGFLYTAGFGPHDPATGVVEGDVAEQTRRTLRNVAAVLATHGLGFEDVVKATVHLQHLDRDFAAFDAAYREVLVAPYPVRTTVGSQLANILVEIDVVAVLRG